MGTNACTTRLTTPGRAVCILRLRVLEHCRILGYKNAKETKTWVQKARKALELSTVMGTNSPNSSALHTKA